MTIFRPTFPPHAESVDSVSEPAAAGQRAAEKRTSESCKGAEGLSRRTALAGAAALAALPIAAANPGAPVPAIDADLIDLGARFEPLLDRYYIAHRRWSDCLARAHAENDEEFGTAAERNYAYPPEVELTFFDRCQRLGVDDADEARDMLYRQLAPLANAINTAPIHSIEGLRVKALVIFWEVAPVGAGEQFYSFEDALPFQWLFTAVAELCGFQDKIAEAGYRMPHQEFAYDDGEDA